MTRALVFCLGFVLLNQWGWAQDASPFPAPKSAKSFPRQGQPQPKPRSREKPKVGPLGNPDALVFTGLRRFSADQLRWALVRDFDVVLAAHAKSELEVYLRTLERRLTEGFRKNGFPQAKVSAMAQPADGKVQVTIEEGQLHRNGRVKVTSAPNVDSDLMVRYLTDANIYRSPNTSSDAKKKSKETDIPQLWKAGEVTNFTENPAQAYKKAVNAGLAAQGYFFPEFELELKPDETGLTELWVHITETGPKAKIGRITVQGNQHHSAEALLEFLGIKSGMPVDNRQRQAWENKLRDSNRFLSGEVIVLPAIGPEAPSELLVRVQEHVNGPHLNDELTEQDKVLAKTANWISNWQGGDEGDCVIVYRTETEFGTGHLLAVISPKNGFGVDLELELKDQNAPLRYTVLVSGETVQLVSWHRNAKLILNGIGQQIEGRMQLTYENVTDESGTSEWKLCQGISVGIQSGKTSPRVFSLDLAPPAAIAFARGNPTDIDSEKGLLSITRKNTIAEIDMSNGKPLGFRPERPQTELAKLKQMVVPKIQANETFVYFQPQAFPKYFNHLNRETKTFAVAEISQRPVSCVMEFLLRDAEWVLRSVDRETPLPIVIRLLERDALAPLDRLWRKYQASKDEKATFDLPISTEQNVSLLGLEKQIPFGMGKPLARMAFGFHALLVPPESGPARVGWNLALLSVGRVHLVTANLDQLVKSPEVGPLTCLYAGKIFGMMLKPVGRKFAQSGLEKLTANDFRREADQLLPKESLLFELVGSFGNAVRQLDDDEFAQLVSLLGDQSQHPALPKMIERIRQQQGTPSRELLLESLVTLWTVRGQSFCREQLEKLADAPELEKSKINYEKLTLDALLPNYKKPKKKNFQKTSKSKNRKLQTGGIPRFNIK